MLGGADTTSGLGSTDPTRLAPAEVVALCNALKNADEAALTSSGGSTDGLVSASAGTRAASASAAHATEQLCTWLRSATVASRAKPAAAAKRAWFSRMFASRSRGSRAGMRAFACVDWRVSVSNGGALTPPRRVENACANPARASSGLASVTTPSGLVRSTSTREYRPGPE